LKNTKKSTKKFKTTRKKTINNTTKKEGGVDSLGTALGTSIQHKRPQSAPTLAITKHLTSTLIFIKPIVRTKFHKIWGRNMFKTLVQE
jgi:hypothetical protein